MQTATITTPPSPGPYRFTVDEYLRMAELGLLHPDVRTELVDGQVIVMSPKNQPHIWTKNAIHEELYDALGRHPRWQVIDQDAIVVSEANAPEPDLAVVPRRPRADVLWRAAEAQLIVEVSDTTLADDLGRKRLLYAGAGVPNYWVADVNLRQVHRFAEPRDGDYAVHEVLDTDDRIRVPGAPDDRATVSVGAFFPSPPASR